MEHTREGLAAKATERGIPEHMVDSLVEYVFDGVPVGDFLTALLSNNLIESYARADEYNTAAMKAWAMVLYNDLPGNVWGSPEKVWAWLKQKADARASTRRPNRPRTVRTGENIQVSPWRGPVSDGRPEARRKPFDTPEGSRGQKLPGLGHGRRRERSR